MDPLKTSFPSTAPAAAPSCDALPAPAAGAVVPAQAHWFREALTNALLIEFWYYVFVVIWAVLGSH